MSLPIDISEEAGVRYLHFGSTWVQGAMRIARPWSLELAYTREMMASLLFRPDAHWPRKVLSIGLGSGSMPKFLYRHRPQARLTVVEIAPEVLIAARQFFKLPDEDGKQLLIHIADGVEHILNTRQRYDLILLDGFDKNARAGALDTLPFYQACRGRLAEDGLMAINLIGRARGLKASLAALNTAFDGQTLSLPSADLGNTVAFAARDEAVPHTITDLRERARALHKETGLNLLPMVTSLSKLPVCENGVVKI